MTQIIVKFNADKVNAAYPEASMFPPMKIWSLPKNKRHLLEEYCNSGDYLASVKIDGYFYTLNRTENHTYLFSRAAGVSGFLSEKIANVPHIEEQVLGLPADTVLCGEIYVPGGESKDVTRIMGCLPAKARERQKAEGNVKYYLYDIVMFAGEDLRDKTFEERMEILDRVYHLYLEDAEDISMAENISENIYETAMDLIAAGAEGMVLKKKDSKYLCEKRPAWSSIKIKPEESFDVVITGFCDPTQGYLGTSIETWEYWVMYEYKKFAFNEDCWIEKERWIGPPKAIRSPDFKTMAVTKAYYYGWKNAIEISAYNTHGELVQIGTISSGLTDEMRSNFAANPKDYLGKVVEVRCMSVDRKEQTLRHGYLVRFRDDKDAMDCPLTDIFYD